MTLLTIVQEVANSVGLTEPSSVINNSNPQAEQLLSLASREGKSLVQAYDWEALTNEATHTTVATESQGALTTIASDFDRFINDTIWNRTDTFRVGGPSTPQRWQRKVSSVTTSIFDTFRVRGGNLLLNPVPAAGETIAFEYISKNWITGDKETFTADSDTILLDEELVTLGIIWRFRAANRLSYDEEKAQYLEYLEKRKASDGGKPKLSMGGPLELLPTANFEDSNWPVPS